MFGSVFCAKVGPHSREMDEKVTELNEEESGEIPASGQLDQLKILAGFAESDGQVARAEAPVVTEDSTRAELTEEIRKLREEFNGQRAKMRELYLQKEGLCACKTIFTFELISGSNTGALCS